MMAIFVAVWIVTFFASFLMFQAFDRHHGIDDPFNMFMNLLLASVPICNVLTLILLCTIVGW
jgi:hypothetical protein